VCVSGLPGAVLDSAEGKTRTRHLSITSPTFYTTSPTLLQFSLPTCAESSGAVSRVEIGSVAVETVVLWRWVVASSTSMTLTVCAAVRPRRPRRPTSINCIETTARRITHTVAFHPSATELFTIKITNRIE